MPSLRNSSEAFSFHPAFVDHAHGIGGVPAQEQIVDHVAFQALVEFLVHHGNSVFQSILRAGEADLFAVQKDFAFVLLIGTEQALHHRGLAGAVFAHQPHDRSALDIQIDVIEHSVTAKGFAHAAD